MSKTSVILLFFAVIAGCKNEVKNTDKAPVATPVLTPKTTELCYQFTRNRDTTTCQLTVNDAGDFTGYYSTTIYEKDGRFGLLTGKTNFGKDTLVADFKYSQEGEISTEELVFVKSPSGLTNLESTVFDKNGVPVMSDRKKLKAGDALLQLDCGKVKAAINYIKEKESFLNTKK
jgi:hypothetical protein